MAGPPCHRIRPKAPVAREGDLQAFARTRDRASARFFPVSSLVSVSAVCLLAILFSGCSRAEALAEIDDVQDMVFLNGVRC